MAAVIIRLRVFINDARFGGERFIAALPNDRLGDLIARLLVEVGIDDNPRKWDLLNDDAVLPRDRTVGELIAISPPTNGLTLRKLSTSDSGTSLSSIFGSTFDIPMTNDASQSGSLAISVTDSDKLNPPVDAELMEHAIPSLRRSMNDLLVDRGVISVEQLEETKRFAVSKAITIFEALTKLQYATEAQFLATVAEAKGLKFVDLTDVEIPKSIIELLPESVARENIVIPLSLDANTLRVVVSDPEYADIVQKLQFILNMDIVPVLAARAQILEAIDRHYGLSETESVDSMLVEFTDTAIEFTRTEAKPSPPLWRGSASTRDAPCRNSGRAC